MTKKKRKSQLEEQIEKDTALACQMGLNLGSSRSMYLNVARNHAQKVVKVGNKVIKGSVWKGKHELKGCDTLVPIKGWKAKRMPKTTVINGKKVTYTPKPHRECGKPITHVVSHEMERFYGKKHIENGYCEKHAKEAVKQLKESTWTFANGTKPDFEPIEIKKLGE